jgi:hypothetical protein
LIRALAFGPAQGEKLQQNCPKMPSPPAAASLPAAVMPMIA